MGHRLLLTDLPEGLTELQEAAIWLDLLSDSGGDLLIIDHYTLGAEFSRAMRQHFRKIMVIDDLANREHDCDILLDQNYYLHPRQRYTHLIPEYCTALLGPEFALLRDEFSHQTAARQPRHLLIGFGGSDEQNLTAQCVNVWPELTTLGVSADIVIGASYPYAQALRRQVEQMKGITLHQNCNYISTLMQRAALMIGSGGTTHWERCISGLPGLIITTADNQTETTACLAAAGACDWLGAYERFNLKALVDKVGYYIMHPQALSGMAQRAAAIMPPGSGISRVTSELEQLIRE